MAKNLNTKVAIIPLAKKIATQINSVETDYKGYLLDQISTELMMRSQYYTAKLFLAIAKEYGIKEPN